MGASGVATSGLGRIESILGDDASLLSHQCKTIPASDLHLPGPDFVDRILAATDRTPRVLSALQLLVDSGRLGRTGYVSILPVDQGIEHSAGASFAPNPAYFDPENIVKLAIEGGCNAVASTLGVLGAVARKYAHKIPFILKFNHNEFISYPNTYDQIRFASIKQAFDMGAAGVGATIYFGSEESKRQLQEVAEMFQQAHELGMFTVLWCYLRNSAFKTKDVDYHLSADLSGQANHLGVTIEADIIKQKLPENNGGYNAINFGKTHKKVYSDLSSDHPIDLTRYQLANCYMGRSGLINSGGESKGQSDMAEAVLTAVAWPYANGPRHIGHVSGFGVPSDVFARYAQDHLFSAIDECGVRDGANLVVHGYDFAPGFSIWTTIEECLNPPAIWEKDRGWYTAAPFSEPEVFDFPEGIGPVECVNVEHEEVALIPRWVDCERVTFKYGLGEEFIDVLRTLHKLGLDSTDPVEVRGQRVNEAFALLRFSKKHAAKQIEKVLKSAVANAEQAARAANAALDVDDLVITKAIINEGPKLKRFTPAAMGRATPMKKRTSHVEIVVADASTRGTKRKGR